ncbi:hypothetical protein EMCRGX_G001270 [Ephydatia muelleri]
MDQPRKPETYSQVPYCPPVTHCGICIATVGLPARGKTYIAKKLARYLRWIGLNTKVFNVGEYRRHQVGAEKSHDFFHPDNQEGQKQRKLCALMAMEDVMHFLKEGGGQAAVFDATNSTRERRQLIIDHCISSCIKVFFIESICDDKDVIAENIKQVKLCSPDYKEQDPEEAVKDFQMRIKNYEIRYETLDHVKDKDLSWVKIYNVDQRYEANKIKDHLEARLVYYLMNIHIRQRCIYLCRHGESICNMYGRIGGNSELSERGKQFAKSLKDFMDEQKMAGFKIWTSQLDRTIQTAQYLCGAIEQWKALNELDVGEYLVHRLEPVIMELERQQNVLVICHQAVMRCILAYFLDKDIKELPYLKVPLHTVMKLTPVAYGCILEEFQIPVPCVDTHRLQPEFVNISRSDSDALKTVPDHL